MVNISVNEPIQQIKQLFEKEHLGTGGNFALELGWYIENGAIRSDNGIAYLARRADTRTPESYEGDPNEWLDKDCIERSNAWFVAYAAGDLKQLTSALKSLQPHFEYLIWGRSHWERGRYRITKTKDFLKHITKPNYGNIK